MRNGSIVWLFILAGSLLPGAFARADGTAAAAADSTLSAGTNDSIHAVVSDSAKDTSRVPDAATVVPQPAGPNERAYVPGVDSSVAAASDSSVPEILVKAVIDVPKGRDLELQNCQDCDTKSWVLKGIHAHLGELTACYQDYLKKQPSLEGKVSLSFSITAFGLARNVRIASSTTGNAAFDLALVARAQGMRFTVPSTEDEVKATVKLKLHRQD